MKIKYYFSIAMAALVMTNCSQEEELQDIQQSGDIHTLTATIEGNSRSAVTDGGVFSWTSGDAISVWNGSSKITYTYSGNGNVFNPSSGSSTNISGYAVYPDGNHTNLSGSSLPTVNLKSSYNYGSTNAIMLAKVQKGSNNLTFSHLGGLMRFTIKNIPSDATSFTFTANSEITGDFQVETQNDGTNVINAKSGNSNKSVTISFTSGQTERTFYVPLPVGTYTGFTITVGNCSYTSQATNTIKRRTLLLMPTFTCDGTQLTKGGNVFTLENTEQDMNVSGEEETLIIETPNSSNANAQLNLNYTPAEENATLNISDGQTGDSQDSKAKVVVDVKNNKTVAELNIDAPTLTVELASGTYDEITAKTAKQTLIIKSGVTVKNLKVIGGKVEIEEGADVKSQTQLRVLTFEDADAKFSSYSLDYAGVDITTWSDLIDDPQYMGPLTYGTNQMDAMYTWWDEGNTELTHTFPSTWDTYCYWSGGHAISNYWGAGYTNEDRDKHISKYYGEDYVTENAGNDSMLGWFNVQWMVPVPAHSGENFAVHFGYIDGMSMCENLPEISFADGEARVIDHMYVCNTNYTLNQLVCGVGSEAGNTFGGSWTGLSDDAWLKIVAYGFENIDDEEHTKETEFYLVNGQNVVENWQKWDLSPLGKVAKVQFNFLYSSEMGGKYGFTIPGYFAYDDIAVQFEN